MLIYRGLKVALHEGWNTLRHTFKAYKKLLTITVLFFFSQKVLMGNVSQQQSKVSSVISKSIRYVPQWGKTEKYFHICGAAAGRGCQTSFTTFETFFQKQDIKYQDRHKAAWDKQRENKLQASPSVSTSAFTSLPPREAQQSQSTNNRFTSRGTGVLHHHVSTICHFCSYNLSFQDHLQSQS